MGYYQDCPLPKPEPRKRAKARKRRERRDRTAEVRQYIFARERDLCRCCRFRAAESMHELRSKSLRGKVSKTNSIAVCGDGVRGCHGFLQRHEIHCTQWDVLGAEDTIIFGPTSEAASEWMRLPLGKTLVSAPFRELEAE